MFSFDVPDNDGHVALTILVVAPGKEYWPINQTRVDSTSPQVVEFYERGDTPAPGKFISHYYLSVIKDHPKGMALKSG